MAIATAWKAVTLTGLVGSSPTSSAFARRSGELRRTQSAKASREGELKYYGARNNKVFK